MRLDGEADTHCVNVECPEQRVQRIVHFAGRGAMDIEGLGEERVRQFVDAGLLSDAGDIYSLTVEQLLPLERMAQTSAENLVAGIDDVEGARPRARARRPRHPSPRADRGAGALARDGLARHDRARASVEELTAVEGVGRVIAESVQQFFAIDRNRTVVDKLRTAGVDLDRADGRGRRGCHPRRRLLRAHRRARRLHP